MSPQCYRMELYTFLVRLPALSHPSHARPKALDTIIDKCTNTDKGTAKIAKDLGIDCAEAVVRA
jgi:hypothetical protein